MAIIKIDLGKLTFTLNFNNVDAFVITPLGCHAGTVGNVSSLWSFKDNNPIAREQEALQIFKEKDLYRKLMNEFVRSAREGFGGWSKPSSSDWKKKGHWIISAPWKTIEYDPTQIGTPELMDLIAQFCDNEPENYGYYTMTRPTDCGAHDNNAGFPATRTMIWVPPFITVSKEKLKTRCTGMYGPRVPGEDYTTQTPSEKKGGDCVVDAAATKAELPVVKADPERRLVRPESAILQPTQGPAQVPNTGTERPRIHRKTYGGMGKGNGPIEPRLPGWPSPELLARRPVKVPYTGQEINQATVEVGTILAIEQEASRELADVEETVRQGLEFPGRKPEVVDHGLPIEAIRMGEPIYQDDIPF